MASTKDNSISRFFQPAKKRPRAERENRETEALSAAGTAEEPLAILDDSDEEEVAEIVTTSPLGGDEKSGIHEPSEGIENVSEPCKEERDTISPSKKENPFASFAHDASHPGGKKEIRPLQWRVSNQCNTETTSKPKKHKTCDKKEGFVKIKDLAAEEQDRITKKWHSLVDPAAPLEVRRFQVLVAARLHARCQEPTVRKAMKSLREAFNEFSVDEVAKADPEVLALYITNLQYYNVKAKQIVKAANEIKSQFSGMVPEDEHSLLQITGVGKVFSDLLAFVNTRSAHTGTIQAA